MNMPTKCYSNLYFDNLYAFNNICKMLVHDSNDIVLPNIIPQFLVLIHIVLNRNRVCRFKTVNDSLDVAVTMYFL